MYRFDANEDVCPLSTPQPVSTHPEHFPASGGSDKRQYYLFIPHMNDNSITAAYLHVPYACRQREIRTPVLQRHMHELLLPPTSPCSPQTQPTNVTMAASHYTL